MGWDKAAEIAGESDLIEIASDSSGETDLFCPRCGGKRNGHECWSAAAAGLAGDDAAEDDDVSVYADEKGAVVITHDREFSLRRRRNTFGRHVWLRCLEPMAVDVLADHPGSDPDVGPPESHRRMLTNR
jgi:hypothetical protein